MVDSRDAWEGGWAVHRLAQLRRTGNLPWPDKLRWLEEAQRLASHMRRDRIRRGLPVSPPPAPDELEVLGQPLP